ncbi:MAG: hypothetical protein KatS3mg115_0646 [Candidatus Poribacteria bacterium]|nr:MAG: hypothetical protein KatS3mg115_0646 [Candidatus Poribacteria bacterium]
MRRKVSFRHGSLSFVLLFLLGAFTRAQEGPILFEDDFSDPNWEARWEIHDDGAEGNPSNWVIGPAGGLPEGAFGNTVNTLRGGGAGGNDEQPGSYALLRDPRSREWTDYRVSAEMYHMDNDYAGLFVRYVDELNYIRAWVKQEEADLGGAMAFSIDKQIDGKWTMFFKTGGPGVGGDGITGTPVPKEVKQVPQRVWFTMTVEVLGDTVTLFIDGVKVASVSDSDFAPGGKLERGTIALYNSTNPMAYDNVVVEGIGRLPVSSRGKLATYWGALRAGR